ncbi:MAG: hypothetical protein CMJ48_13920 [Planctomycetaceae bacterium]|nr:hypothetical protein [Planctomycetaceae bacterium]
MPDDEFGETHEIPNDRRAHVSGGTYFFTWVTGQVAFGELPGNPNRLFLSARTLLAMKGAR